MNQPQVWHHGLVARYSAQFWSPEGGEGTEYFGELIQASGQPALEIGCGTGRLLLPYLRAGLDVEGCDTSQDMLAQCVARAQKMGLSPQLYAQAMHQLDLPRRYQLIYACGVIGLGGERQLTRQGMQRCYEHLRAGGAFAFDLSTRWNEPAVWLERLAENRQKLPEAWPQSSERKEMPDGTEMEVAFRTVAVDPLAETQVRQLRVRLWRNGELVEEQVQTQHYEEYGKNELMLMLEQAGFTDIQIFGDYSAELATADHKSLIFVARK
ncbi:MAG: class I SAM-dependent methyltransferase [Caldilinea sp. CFX5]|nr:class I SAM-dependent methyltransferase [Caldilinea sp. CFX5]